MLEPDVQYSRDQMDVDIGLHEINLHDLFTRIRKSNLEPFVKPSPEHRYKVFNADVFGAVNLIVMSAYEDMYDSLKTTRESHSWSSSRMPPKLFYMGQPGIGKTVFRLYALARCCQDSIPVAIVAADADFLYYLPPDQDKEPSFIPIRPEYSAKLVRGFLPDPGTVVLFDSNLKLREPPSCISSLRRMLVVSASPKYDRWSWARKDSNQRFYYVPLPLESDIRALAERHQQPNMLNVYRLIGPCPRLLVEHSYASEDVLTSEYTLWASDLVGSKGKINAVMDNFGSTAQSHPQHFHCFFYLTGHAFLLEKQPGNRPFLPKHLVGTDFLLRILRWKLQQKHAQEIEDMLELVQAQPVLVGILFEAHLLATIKRGHLNHAYYLSERPDHPHYLPQSQSDTTSPFTQELVLNKEGSLPSLEPDREHHLIWVGPDFPTVEGVVVTSSTIRLLQVMMSTRLRLLDSGFQRVHTMLEANNMIGQREWHFVFITPSDAAGRQLVNSGAAKKLVDCARKNFSLALEMGHMTVERKAGQRWLNHFGFQGPLHDRIETTVMKSEGFEEDVDVGMTAESAVTL